MAVEIPKYNKKSPILRLSAEKDPVPNLADYLTPIEPLVLRVDDTELGIESQKDSERAKKIPPRRTTSKEYLDMYNFFEKLNKW